MMRALTKTSPVALVMVGLTVLVGSLWAGDVPPPVQTTSLTERAGSGHDVQAGYSPSREVRRWTEFESEFGIQEKSPSAMKGTLQEAKYNLDQTVFDLDNFVNDLADTLELEYRPEGRPSSARALSRTYFSPVYDIWANSRLKSEVDLDVSTGAFVGVTFQFPFGN